MNLKFILCWIFLICSFLSLKAQTDSLNQNTFFKAPVQDILNLPVKESSRNEIVSASKKAEDIFDAPIAASVVTREEIQKAGALSIAEALRLLPGVLVRETSNGNYDINIRGFNNTPPGSDLYVADNTNSLVMINNRPVFNYFSGGTLWEALPIDINDVERIEIIRGPSSALYGSNAVTGVINIITRKIDKEGFFATGNMEAGNLNTVRGLASMGYAPNNKFQVITSFNYTQKDRTMSELYSFTGQRYLDIITDTVGIVNYQSGNIIKGNADFIRKFPQKNISMDRYGINSFINYKPNSFLSFDLSLGMENSYAVRPFAENAFTPYSAMYSQTKYIDLRAQIKDGSVQISYLFGNQKPGLESLGANFDLNVLDVQADYNFTLGGLNIRPGISYKRTQYDDSKYFNTLDLSIESGIINGKKVIQILSPSLRLDYKIKQLRLIAAVRVDRFILKDNGNIFEQNAVDNAYNYLSYQFAATYKLKEKHLFRISYGQANRGAFFTEIYSNFRDNLSPLAPGVSLQTVVIGDPNLKLRTSRNLEFGYRFQWNKKFSIDIEAFQADAKDYTSIILSIDTVFSPTGVIIRPTFTQTNIQARIIQRGITFSVNYNPVNNLQANLFVSLQETDIFDFSPSNISPELDPTGTNNYLTLQNIKDYKGTPKFYGGFNINYSFSKFNLNLNGYFFGRQELTHVSDVSLGRASTIATVNEKLILGCKFSYQPYKAFRIYINGRNILNQNSYEYIFTDNAGTIFSGGIQYEF